LQAPLVGREGPESTPWAVSVPTVQLDREGTCLAAFDVIQITGAHADLCHNNM
jgi:hypothetical protein